MNEEGKSADNSVSLVTMRRRRWRIEVWKMEAGLTDCCGN
jgi:hypothetical protein